MELLCYPAMFIPRDVHVIPFELHNSVLNSDLAGYRIYFTTSKKNMDDFLKLKR